MAGRSSIRANPVTIKNLERGIDKTFEAREKKRPRQSGEGTFDFDDTLYCQLEVRRQTGLDKRFWDFLVDTLWDWRAIRSKVEPNSKESIRNRGLERFSSLKKYYIDVAKKAHHSLTAIQVLQWTDVEPLFEVAQSIKNTTRPTFGSKLCHFLVPSAFFVWDNKLVVNRWTTYQEYWEECRTVWIGQSELEKRARINQLKIRMPKNFQPCAAYPWATKITELCQRP